MFESIAKCVNSKSMWPSDFAINQNLTIFGIWLNVMQIIKAVI